MFNDSKIAIKKEKWQLTETERIFVNDAFDSGLTCRGDEELLLWKDNPVKVGKILNRYFYNNVHRSIKQIKKAHTIGQQKNSNHNCIERILHTHGEGYNYKDK